MDFNPEPSYINPLHFIGKNKEALPILVQIFKKNKKGVVPYAI